MACKFTRPQFNREFVGTGKMENVEGATKYPRGTQGAIRRAWNSVTHEDYYRIVSSMPRRIQAVIAAKGAATKY